MESRYKIRRALPGDVARIVAFTVAEAQESQGAAVDPIRVHRAVEAALGDPRRATYWVVETDAGEVVGSTSITTEWSDFHAADYWWVQSLYIAPEHRGHGLPGQVFAHLDREATRSGALELRLYVHHGNERAVRAYEKCGFAAAPYMIMQREPPTA